MKVITHKVDNEFFEGSVEMSIPSFSERMKILKEINYKSESGQVDASSDNLDKFSKSVEKVKELVGSVNIKIKSSGEEIKTLDDLSYYNEGTAVLVELTGLMQSGISLGKPLQAS